MRRNMMVRSLRRSITKSVGRYIAIAMIISLGTAIFVGLRSTKTDMVATGRDYMAEQNMFDLRIISSYGWNRDQLEPISALDGLAQAEGVFYSDLIVSKPDGEDASVFRFYTIPKDINKLVLLEGRMPKSSDECLADGFRNGKSYLGKKVNIADDNSTSALDQLTVQEFTVVGIVSTPLYMDMNRGNTSVGNGSISNYYFVPESAFDVDYYTEIYAKIPGTYDIYTQEYNDAMSDAAERLKPLLTPFAEERMKDAKADAEKALADGRAEYEDGLREYREEKADALKQLEEAYQKLLDGEDEIRQAELDLQEAQQKVYDGWDELNANKEKLDDAEKQLDSAAAGGQYQLSSANATLAAKQAELESNAQQLEAGLIQISSGLVEVKSGITQIKTGMVQLNAGIRTLETLIKVADINISTTERTLNSLSWLPISEEKIQEAQKLLEEARNTRADYESQRQDLLNQKEELNAKLDELYAMQSDLENKQQELVEQRELIRDGRTAIRDGYEEIYRQRSSADSQIISARQRMIDGGKEIRSYEKELQEAEREIAEGEKKLTESRDELANGWKEYEEAKREAYDKFAEAEAELEDAARKLAEAEETISGITKTDVYVLDRSSNIGYSSLNSSSDIVAGVAKVFPVFFILVAALVCITTMTRMVDEERTQIGTLKALGYSSFSIISKYLLYAGSSAVLGCMSGVALGNVVFPTILWEAYKIMLFVKPGITLEFDWKMAAEVALMYTSAMLLVTWYCCHKTLQEVPAELIRPKAPTAGKELFIEKLPLWHHISFLNKVAIRNIFRYRQRMAMMLLGIGGCTALLMTGFGIRDSISKIVDVQFRDVTSYDLMINFRNARTEEEQNDFQERMELYSDSVFFFYQVSGEIEANSQTRDISIIAAESGIADYIDFHYGVESVPMPQQNEVVLSAGIVDMLSLKLGDTVVLRNPDMEMLTLTVSGIYENHVQNYAIVNPNTIQQQWGRELEPQTAYAKVRPGRNPSYAGAAASGLSGVVNVTVSQQLADMVGTMMKALDLVVWVVVFCAGVLAVIVLYNLTNININERIREIATIKVLGFNASETAMYVFKENLVLTVFGTAFGIPLGKLLLDFVISQIKIDMIWIKPLLTPESLVISVILTVLSAVAVDGIFYFKLDKINMAEALKSVE